MANDKWETWKNKKAQDSSPKLKKQVRTFSPQNLYMCSHCMGAGVIYENIGVNTIIYLPTMCENCGGKGNLI